MSELHAVVDVQSRTGLDRFKLARTEDRASDFRWGPEQAPPPLPPPPQEAQQQAPTADQQPMCAAAAMMHGLPPNMHPSSSRQAAACPPIHEHRPWVPQAVEEVQYPMPGYRVAANIWNIDIQDRSNAPGPMASFLRHVSTMQSPENPGYVNDGPPLVSQTAGVLQTACGEEPFLNRFAKQP